MFFSFTLQTTNLQHHETAAWIRQAPFLVALGSVVIVALLMYGAHTAGKRGILVPQSEKHANLEGTSYVPLPDGGGAPGEHQTWTTCPAKDPCPEMSSVIVYVHNISQYFKTRNSDSMSSLTIYIIYYRYLKERGLYSFIRTTIHRKKVFGLVFLDHLYIFETTYYLL